MYYLRPIEKKDQNTFIQFAQDVGFGFSLPRSEKLLEEKINDSIGAFSESVRKPKHETYYLVCESLEGEIVGISGLVSRIGMTEPFYAYHMLYERHRSRFLNIDMQIPVLHFIKARKKPTEICSLFVKKQCRGTGCGKLLSLGRFLLIAAFPKRFAPTIIGELRGVQDEDGNAPFWDAVGRHFFQIPFQEAHFVRLEHPECIEELFPEHPIYAAILPKEAQQAIGLPHKETICAWEILKKQGFIKSNYIDLFEAGPHVYAPTKEVKTIRESVVSTVGEFTESLEGELFGIIANEKLSFRAALAPFKVDVMGTLTLETKTKQALQIEKGDTIRYYAFKP